MALLTIAKQPAFWWMGRQKKRPVSRRIVPRGFLRFSILLTIGMAASTVVLTLLGMFTGDFLAVFALGVMTMAVWQALSFFIASVIMVHRCLVVLCERLVDAFPWPARRMKLQVADLSPGVTDDWMDGPY